MTHRCTAVVYDPAMERALDDSVTLRQTGASAVELYEFEVSMWYEAFDLLVHEIEMRHPRLRRSGIDDLEIRAFSMIRVEG